MFFLNHRRYIYISGSLYFACAAAFGVLAGYTVGAFTFDHIFKVILSVIAAVCGFLGSYFRCLSYDDAEKSYRLMKNSILILFLFYIMVLIDFTLIDDSLGRNIFNIYSWDKNTFSDYLENSVNLIPFFTVKLFWQGYLNGNLSFGDMAVNIVGNVIAFMPLAFFLPIFFKRINKWYSVLLTVALCVVFIELMQLAFLTGATDVDDVILNTAGAMLMYGILRIKKTQKFISNVTFGVFCGREK